MPSSSPHAQRRSNNTASSSATSTVLSAGGADVYIPLTVNPSHLESERDFASTKSVSRLSPHARGHDDEELDPDSDAAYLRRHRQLSSDSDETDDDYDPYTSEPQKPSSYFSPLQRFTTFMSRIPLLMRTSPALGTGSYGAAPTSFGSTPEEQLDNFTRQREAARRRAEALGSPAEQEEWELSDEEQTPRPNPKRRASAGVAPLSRRYLRPTRSSSELGMGPDSKATFASGSGFLHSSALDSSSYDSSAETDAMHEATDGSEDEDDLENPVDNSQYAQVRASVPATDDYTLSINTPRMWTLSLMFALSGSATNLFFSLRYPSVAITPVIALVLVHPLGKMWDLVLKRADDPEEVFENGQRQGFFDDPERYGKKSKLRLWLAQGRWNEKEHACVYISSNVSFGFAFATDVIVEQYKFYNQETPIMYQILLTISTQCLGYAFAGLTRRFLVRPAAMIWPGTLMSTAMFSAMHKNENKPADGWRVSRYKFFVYVWAGAFLWYFVPGLLVPALSYFNVITWFAPKSVVVANLVSKVSSTRFQQY